MVRSNQILGILKERRCVWGEGGVNPKKKKKSEWLNVLTDEVKRMRTYKRGC
jgi:hypothetical protein